MSVACYWFSFLSVFVTLRGMYSVIMIYVSNGFDFDRIRYYLKCSDILMTTFTVFAVLSEFFDKDRLLNKLCLLGEQSLLAI